MESILQQILLRLDRIENTSSPTIPVRDNFIGQRAGDTAYVDSNTLRENRRTSFYNRDRENGQHDPTMQNDSFNNHFTMNHPTSTPTSTTPLRPNIIQSVVALDARTSGIQLTNTTFAAVYKWSKALKREQEYSRYEDVLFSNYISEDIR
jgi:hypothetical protein